MDIRPTIITSFSGSLYYTSGQNSLRSFIAKGQQKNKIFAYHENSHENTCPLKGRNIQPIDFIDGVRFFDIFEQDFQLKKIVQFEEYMKSSRYLNKSAPFFFRKVASIRHAITNNPSDLFCWLDADTFFKKPFDKPLIDFVLAHDICYLDRVKMPTESGIIFFNTANKKVIEFVEAWYDLTASKKVFRVLKDWADHNTFDYVRKSKQFSDLRFGKLRTGAGRKIWYDSKHYNDVLRKEYSNEKGWDYLYHNKGIHKALDVRVKKSSKKTEIRGHLYVAFGETYDMLAVHSCELLRKVSNFPIHIVTNIKPSRRHEKWNKISNVTFSYVHLATEDNREVKTSMIHYSPFDITLYTDCDSVILSERFKEVFKFIKGNDILMPVYYANCTSSLLNTDHVLRHQKAAFLHALKKVTVSGFSKEESFTIYGGGVCVFRKTKTVFDFFEKQNHYWEKTGGGRDMPAISIASVTTPGLKIGLLTNDYNRNSSKTIQSIHGMKASPLPRFVAYHPDLEGNYKLDPIRDRKKRTTHTYGQRISLRRIRNRVR